MRYVVGLICIAVLAVFFLVECGEAITIGGPGGEGAQGGEGGRGGEGGQGARGGEGGRGGVDIEIVTLYAYTYEFDPPLIELDPPYMMPRLPGVRVCQRGTDNCATSDARGFVELRFSRNHEEIAITTEKEGYVPRVYGNVLDDQFPDAGFDRNDPVGFSMFTREEMAAVAEQLGTAYPWEGGIVGLLRWQSPTPGVKFMPVGSTVDQVGASFYFDREAWQYSRNLKATTSQYGLSEFALAEGGFIEVTPGTQQFEIAGTAGDCSHVSWGWPGDAPNRIRVPVIEGYITYGSMRCGPP